MLQPVLKLLVLNLAVLTALSTTALAGFFVIPAGRSESNTITVKTTGGDFTAPVDAMNSITDSNEENPYLILMGPGTFNIAADTQLIMKPYVHILGSGSSQTTISGSRSTTEFYDFSNGALIRGSSDTSLKGLTIVNATNNGDNNSVGVFFQNSHASIEDVNIHMSGTSDHLRGLYTDNSTLTLANIDILVDTGINRSDGAYFDNNSVINADELTVQISSGNGEARGIAVYNNSVFSVHTLSLTISEMGLVNNDGIFITNAQAELSSATITVANGSGQNYGIYLNLTSKCIVMDSNISASGGTQAEAFHQSNTSSSIINNCTLSGSPFSSYNAPSASGNNFIDAINTEMIGVAVNTNCIRCFNADGTALDSSCNIP